MSDLRVRWLLRMSAVCAVGAVVAISGGCIPKPRPTVVKTQPPPTTRPDTAEEISARVRDLTRQAEDYGSLGHQLPGRTPEEHRELVAKVFASLTKILPMLQPPQSSLVFRQQMMIIDNSRAQLSASSQDLASEPTIDTGLRAAYNALVGLSKSPNYEQVDLTGQLDALLAKLNELDATHGLTHQVVVGETVELSSGVISKMADVLSQRLSTDAGTQPSTEPVAEPSTEPAPGPTTTPAASSGVPATALAPTTAPEATPATAPAAPATEPAATTEPASPAAPETAPAAAPADAPATAPATVPADPSK